MVNLVVLSPIFAVIPFLFASANNNKKKTPKNESQINKFPQGKQIGCNPLLHRRKEEIEKQINTT
jgi:hypothetical protein